MLFIARPARRNEPRQAGKKCGEGNMMPAKVENGIEAHLLRADIIYHHSQCFSTSI